MVPILRLTFLEWFCNFRQFGFKKNDWYFFRFHGYSGPIWSQQYFLLLFFSISAISKLTDLRGFGKYAWSVYPWSFVCILESFPKHCFFSQSHFYVKIFIYVVHKQMKKVTESQGCDQTCDRQKPIGFNGVVKAWRSAGLSDIIVFRTAEGFQTRWTLGKLWK